MGDASVACVVALLGLVFFRISGFGLFGCRVWGLGFRQAIAVGDKITSVNNVAADPVKMLKAGCEANGR